MWIWFLLKGFIFVREELFLNIVIWNIEEGIKVDEGKKKIILWYKRINLNICYGFDISLLILLIIDVEKILIMWCKKDF